MSDATDATDAAVGVGVDTAAASADPGAAGTRAAVAAAPAETGAARSRDTHGAVRADTVSRLLNAVIWELDDDVRALLAEGADPNARDTKTGMTQLHAAATVSTADVVLALLEFGAAVNALDGDGWTPLHYAANRGNHDGVEVVRVLVNAGADVNAVASGHFPVCREVDVTPLYLAILTGCAEAVDVLVAGGARVVACGCSWSPLRLAAWMRFAEIVQVLLNAGADPDEGSTRVALATCNGDVGEVRAQLAKGVHKLGTKDDSKITMFWAANYGYADIVQLLLEDRVTCAKDFGPRLGDGGSKPTRRDTPLHVAASRGHEHVVELLLEAGFSVHSCGVQSPLLCSIVRAARYTDTAHVIAVMRLLLNAGAAVTDMDPSGETVLQCAIHNYWGRRCHADILVYLLSRLPEGSSPDLHGTHWHELKLSAQCHSMACCHTDGPVLVKALLARGATCDIKRRGSGTLLDSMPSSGRDEAEALFERHRETPFTIDDVPQAFIPLLTENPLWKADHIVACWATRRWGCGSASASVRSASFKRARAWESERAPFKRGGDEGRPSVNEFAPAPYNVGLPTEMLLWQTMPRNVVALVLELSCDLTDMMQHDDRSRSHDDGQSWQEGIVVRHCTSCRVLHAHT